MTDCLLRQPRSSWKDLLAKSSYAPVATSHGSAPTGLPVRVSERPVIREQEPNDKLDLATAAEAPATCVGVIQSPGDADYFRFHAKKNQTLHLNVWGRRLRSPIDSVLRVFDSEGRRLAGNDDNQGQPDSYLRFRAPSDGDFCLQVTDHLGRGDQQRSYVVEIARLQPRVELTILEQRRYTSTTIDVPQGNRTAVLVNTKRFDFRDPLDCQFANLPEGVQAEAPTVAANYYRSPVVFSAEESAPLAASLVEVTAQRPKNAALRSVFRQQEWYVRGANNVSVWSHFANRAPVAVTQRAPFKLRLQEPKAPLVQDGARSLRVTAQRDAGFDQPIAVRMLYHPPGVSSNGSRSIRKGTTDVEIPVTANNRAGIGDWDIVVIGEANIGGRLTVSTQLVKLAVRPPFFTTSLPKASAKRGESIEYSLAIKPQQAFSGEAKLELIGLPPGVSAVPATATSDTKTAAFQVVVDKSARLGRHRSVACRVTLQVEGEPVVWTQRGGQLVIDPNKQTKPQRTAAREDKHQGTSS